MIVGMRCQTMHKVGGSMQQSGRLSGKLRWTDHTPRRILSIHDTTKPRRRICSHEDRWMFYRLMYARNQFVRDPLTVSDPFFFEHMCHQSVLNIAPLPRRESTPDSRQQTDPNQPTYRRAHDPTLSDMAAAREECQRRPEQHQVQASIAGMPDHGVRSSGDERVVLPDCHLECEQTVQCHEAPDADEGSDR